MLKKLKLDGSMKTYKPNNSQKKMYFLLWGTEMQKQKVKKYLE